jgi:hypothetical protein
MLGLIEGLSKQMKGLAVNMSATKPARRQPSQIWQNIWRGIFRKMGHHPNEFPTRKDVHYVEGEEEEQEEQEDPNYGTYDVAYKVMPVQGGQPVQCFLRHLHKFWITTSL